MLREICGDLVRHGVKFMCWVWIDKKTQVLQAGEQTQQTYWHQVTKWIFLDWSGCQQLVHVPRHERSLTLTTFSYFEKIISIPPMGLISQIPFLKKGIPIKLPLQSSTTSINAQYQPLHQTDVNFVTTESHKLLAKMVPFPHFWWEPEKTWSFIPESLKLWK